MERILSTTRLVGRIDRIAATRQERTILNAADAIADHLGVTTQEVLDEAHRLHHEARRLAITPVAVVVRECGLGVTEVRLEVAQQRVPIASRGVG